MNEVSSQDLHVAAREALDVFPISFLSCKQKNMGISWWDKIFLGQSWEVHKAGNAMEHPCLPKEMRFDAVSSAGVHEMFG